MVLDLPALALISVGAQFGLHKELNRTARPICRDRKGSAALLPKLMHQPTLIKERCMSDQPFMSFEEFLAFVEKERPETLTSGQVAKVKPTPWILRAGHGKDARVRMVLGGEHRYEREPGSDEWQRVERSEFDVLDDAA